MQAIHIQVKDPYVPNVLELLNSLKNVMVESIRLDTPPGTEDDTSLIELQESAMHATWDNEADEAWDEV